MTLGVAIGVLIADIVVVLIGTGWWQLSIVVALAPIIYVLNLYFRGRLSTAYRIM